MTWARHLCDSDLFHPFWRRPLTYTPIPNPVYATGTRELLVASLSFSTIYSRLAFKDDIVWDTGRPRPFHANSRSVVISRRLRHCAASREQRPISQSLHDSPSRRRESSSGPNSATSFRHPSSSFLDASFSPIRQFDFCIRLLHGHSVHCFFLLFLLYSAPIFRAGFGGEYHCTRHRKYNLASFDMMSANAYLAGANRDVSIILFGLPAVSGSTNVSLLAPARRL